MQTTLPTVLKGQGCEGAILTPPQTGEESPVLEIPSWSSSFSPTKNDAEETRPTFQRPVLPDEAANTIPDSITVTGKEQTLIKTVTGNPHCYMW